MKSHIKSSRKTKNLALQDFILTLTQFRRFFIMTGVLDIKLQYRRSTLGPWWITLSMILFVSILSITYSKLVNVPIKTQLPLVACGYAVWYLISTSITSGANIFMQNQGYISQINIPVSVYIFRSITKNLVIFCHNFVVCIALILLFNPINLNTLLFIPGMLLLILNLYWVMLLLGMIGSRYRDIPPIITSLIQVIFLATPIAWPADKIGEYSKILIFNPFYYAIDLTRAPLMGEKPMLLSWGVGVGLFIIGTSITFILLNKYRTRIPYWVG
tara:strand:+ start:73 stop:888 length:816 start_codon:yes stop_codon:yes gene_type:complete